MAAGGSQAEIIEDAMTPTLRIEHCWSGRQEPVSLPEAVRLDLLNLNVFSNLIGSMVQINLLLLLKMQLWRVVAALGAPPRPRG